MENENNKTRLIWISNEIYEMLNIINDKYKTKLLSSKRKRNYSIYEEISNDLKKKSPSIREHNKYGVNYYEYIKLKKIGSINVHRHTNEHFDLLDEILFNQLHMNATLEDDEFLNSNEEDIITESVSNIQQNETVRFTLIEELTDPISTLIQEPIPSSYIEEDIAIEPKKQTCEYVLSSFIMEWKNCQDKFLNQMKNQDDKYLEFMTKQLQKEEEMLKRHRKESEKIL